MYTLTSLDFGSLALCVLLAVLTAISKFYSDGNNLAGSSAGVAFIFLFSGVFAIFFNSTGWIVASELFPLHLRAKGVGFAIFTVQITAIWLTQVTTIAFNRLKWKFYLIFIAYNAVSALIYYFYLPEVNGLTLEQIGGLFGDETPNLDAQQHASAVVDEKFGLSDKEHVIHEEYQTPKQSTA